MNDIRKRINASNTPEGRGIARVIKNYLKKTLNADEVEYSSGYFYSSGFVRKGDKYVYISTRDYRFDNWQDNILYRTATGFKDYTGGRNQFAIIEELPSKVQALLN